MSLFLTFCCLWEKGFLKYVSAHLLGTCTCQELEHMLLIKMSEESMHLLEILTEGVGV